MSQTQFDPIDTAAAILDAFNAHDLNAIMDFFADDCSLDMPRGCDHCEFRDGKIVEAQ